MSASLLAQASASPNSNAGDVSANVVNGSGLIGGIQPTSQHNQSGTATAWLSGATAANSQLDFDLGDPFGTPTAFSLDRPQA